MEELEELESKLIYLEDEIRAQIIKIQRPKSSKLGEHYESRIFIQVDNLWVNKLVNKSNYHTQYEVVERVNISDGSHKYIYTYFDMTPDLEKLIIDLKVTYYTLSEKLIEFLDLPSWIKCDHQYPYIYLTVKSNKYEHDTDKLYFKIKYHPVDELESVIDKIKDLFQSDLIENINWEH